ncbi:thioredoxin-like protein 1 [Teratosphaeria destructans]|uniref:Thioredoxin-like protein 1 n=1 Tax=Teratosphaeria destructans TaxID=418781 RepID=A0A9W7SML4_9PEZI|nr:thioredoxin-like protein 1 [Teratosphaeria destructans]
MSKTVEITSPQHFTQVLSSSRVVVVDFWADWCGPCKAIAPVYEQLSSQLSRPGTITFTKVNTDQQKDITHTYNITAMPTFLIFKAGRETKRIRGADPKGLDAAVKQLAQEAGKADEGGAIEGSSSGSSWAGAAAPRNYSDITDSVDVLGLDFLNLDGEKGDKRAVFASSKPSSLGESDSTAKDWVESDTDEQLMLFVPFQSTLKLHTLHITSLPPADEEISRPKSIKLYTNRSTVLGFDEADDTPCTQDLEIKESDWDSKTGTAKAELRFVKFQNISSLVLFVVDNAGGTEKTRIDRIRLFGETGEKRAMGKLEKIGDEQGE